MSETSEDAAPLASTTQDVVASSEPSRKSHLRAALGVLALAAGFALIPRATDGCASAALDEEAPDWDAKIVANAGAVTREAGVEPTDRLDLKSLRGHAVVLDFWATWCGPCQMEAPIVNTIAQRYRSRGLAVVGVNTSDEDGLAAAFVRKKQLGFPVVYDESNTIAKKYGVRNLPTLVVISKTGKIVAVRTGVTSDNALDEIVRRYL